jgi:predicted  nucleic acid-binding Zn-ribbon protein
MTDAGRLEAIFDRLGNIERESARHHALMEGEMARVGDKLEALEQKVKTQNGRVGKLENQVGELQVKARIAESHDTEDDAKAAVISARVWALLTGSFLVILGAVIGYFL